MKKTKQTVFVGLSGGVDSAVSAALLQKAGHDVVGVFIRTWHPDFIECNEEEERLDAMRVAAHLDIPFLTFDLEKEYKEGVADYMIREYKAGRTPNPDVMCNKEVKFGAFLKKALSMGADFVATGHYARVGGERAFEQEGLSEAHPRATKQKDFAHQLYKSIDPSKDQSYFLWTLNQSQLSKILFPIGHLKKTEVRKLAKKFDLPVAEKHDSQGICFLGDIDLKEFLKHYIKEKKGYVVNEKGEVIGHHDGAVFHTLGERHGFTITEKSPNDGAYYVVAKDIKKNTLVVSQKKNYFSQSLGDSLHETTPSKTNSFFVLKLEQTNWISEIPKDLSAQAGDKTHTAQIRYHGEFLPCKIKINSKTKAEVIFEKPALVAPGQSIVVYDKDICMGGGVVK